MDIQGELGDEIHSISNGIVVFNGYDSYYGNAVYVNFKYNNSYMQVRYAHLQSPSDLEIGQRVYKNDIIGYMGDMGNGALLEITILQSIDGSICEIDNSNAEPVEPMLFMERPVCSDLYLQYPMATSVNTTSITGYSRIVWPREDNYDPNIRYRKNFDLDEGEVYLRKIVLEYALTFDKKATNENLGSKGFLTYNTSTDTATVKLNGKIVSYGVGLGNAVYENGRLVVNKDDLWLDIMGSNEGSGNIYSQSGLDYIKSWEKCSLTSYDAQPGKGDWTIGWEHKLHEYDGQENNPNITITQETADKYFEEDIKLMLDTTFTTFLKDNKITLTTNQFDAMLSFTFNHGEYSWGSGDNAKTTMKNFLIARDYSEDATRKAFKHYIDQIDSAQSGNIKRRNDEIEMFLYGTYNYHK